MCFMWTQTVENSLETRWAGWLEHMKSHHKTLSENTEDTKTKLSSYTVTMDDFEREDGQEFGFQKTVVTMRKRPLHNLTKTHWQQPELQSSSPSSVSSNETTEASVNHSGGYKVLLTAAGQWGTNISWQYHSLGHVHCDCKHNRMMY